MATKHPTRQQWTEIEGLLDMLWSGVHLDCDGYLVHLCLARVRKMQLGITVSVNGLFKGAWIMCDTDIIRISDEDRDIGRRFMRPHERPLYSPAERKKLRLGKKGPPTSKVRYAYWTCAAALRRHLVRHNDRITYLAGEAGIERWRAACVAARAEASAE